MEKLTLLLKHSRRYILGYHRRQVNFAVIHFGRVGSTVLQDLISQHPDVHMVGEPWETFRRRADKLPWFMNSPRRLIWFYLCQTQQPIFGLQVKLYPEEHLRPSLLNMSIQEGFNYLISAGFTKFIFIKRINHLERIISDTRGIVSRQWHRGGDQINSTPRVKLDPKSVHFGDTEIPLLESFERLDDYETNILKLIGAHDHLILEFENDIENDPLKAAEKTFRFLRLPKFEATVRLKRTGSQPWHEKIQNPKEVASALDGTPYQWMTKR